MHPSVDLADRKFGKLLVKGKWPLKDRHGHIQWECECECGNVVLALASNLNNGKKARCKECWQETMKGNKRHYKHGYGGMSEYKSWQMMLYRCYNEKGKDYQDYGGRGIIVCDRWLESFENFLEDMGLKPGPKYSVERKDTNGNYSPENCKWATMTEQHHNKRSNVWIEAYGKRMIVADWARLLRISSTQIKYWFDKGHSIPWIIRHFHLCLPKELQT